MSAEQNSIMSPAKVPLPVSPQDSTRSLEFEALIDLFTGDDSNPEPARSQHPSGMLDFKSATAGPSGGISNATSGLTLRDKDGRLDFSKIKALYVAPTSGIGIGIDSDPPRDPIASESARRQSGGVGFENDDRQGDLHGELNFVVHPNSTVQGSTSTNNNLRGAGSSSRTRGLSFESTSPHAFDADQLPAVAESTPLASSRPLGPDNVNFVDLSLNPSSWFPEPDIAEELIRSPDRVPDKQGSISKILENPAHSLYQSLILAQRELVLLKTRCHELEELIRELRPSPQRQDELAPSRSKLVSHLRPMEVGDRASHEKPDNQQGEAALANQGAATASYDSQAMDIDNLAFAQTRIALKSLLNDLALSSSCLPSLLKDSGKGRTDGHVFSLDEIHRAVDMVTYVDELVWRRSRFGALYDNPYSAESIVALRERLELWAKAVRTRH